MPPSLPSALPGAWGRLSRGAVRRKKETSASICVSHVDLTGRSELDICLTSRVCTWATIFLERGRHSELGLSQAFPSTDSTALKLN